MRKTCVISFNGSAAMWNGWKLFTDTADGITDFAGIRPYFYQTYDLFSRPCFDATTFRFYFLVAETELRQPDISKVPGAIKTEIKEGSPFEAKNGPLQTKKKKKKVVSITTFRRQKIA